MARESGGRHRGGAPGVVARNEAGVAAPRRRCTPRAGWKRFLEWRMRLASADFTWPGLRPEFVLDLIAELDLQGVSMAFMGGYTARRPEDVAADPEGWGERVAAELAARGLEPADVFLIPNVNLVNLTVNHPDPAEREQAETLFAAF